MKGLEKGGVTQQEVTAGVYDCDESTSEKGQ